MPSNNGMQLTALRAAADAGRPQLDEIKGTIRMLEEQLQALHRQVYEADAKLRAHRTPTVTLIMSEEPVPAEKPAAEKPVEEQPGEKEPADKKPAE